MAPAIYLDYCAAFLHAQLPHISLVTQWDRALTGRQADGSTGGHGGKHFWLDIHPTSVSLSTSVERKTKHLSPLDVSLLQVFGRQAVNL